MADDETRSFTTGYPLFTILGFRVRLDLSWLLLGLLITWTLAAGVFPETYPELATQTYWWMGVAGALGILFSIVFHELSHSLVARYYGLPIGGITLFIFGGIAEMREEPASPKVEFLMAVAGPLASLLLALIFWQAENLIVALEWPAAIEGVIGYLAFINLVLAIFNLFPAFPLDGGRMLRAALWGWRHNLQSATRIGSEIGAWFGVFLMALGVVAFISGSFVGGMWYLLIGAFLRGAAKASYRQLLTRQFLQDRPVREFMAGNPITVPPSISLRQFVDDYVYRHRARMFPVVDEDELVGYVTLDTVKEVSEDEWSGTSVGDVMSLCTPDNTVSPDHDGAELLKSMAKPGGSGPRMVVEDGHLLGVVSLEDLRRLLSLRAELGNRN